MAGRDADARSGMKATEHPGSPKAGPKLLESLVCPATGGRLEYDPANQELVSRSAMLAYPIRSGIPIMLTHEARKLEE